MILLTPLCFDINSLEYIFNNNINIEISSGPNINPKNPNRFSPIITPNTPSKEKSGTFKVEARKK